MNLAGEIISTELLQGDRRAMCTMGGYKLKALYPLGIHVVPCSEKIILHKRSTSERGPWMIIVLTEAALFFRGVPSIEGKGGGGAQQGQIQEIEFGGVQAGADAGWGVRAHKPR